MDKEFDGQGFVYSEQVTSPDGRFRLLLGVSGGEKTSTIVEPRIVEAASGRIVVDLWDTYLNYSTTFIGSGKVRLRIQDVNQTWSRDADVDLDSETFAFADTPAIQEPLSRLSERLGPR